jgi:hypothetical protein
VSHADSEPDIPSVCQFDVQRPEGRTERFAGEGVPTAAEDVRGAWMQLSGD